MKESHTEGLATHGDPESCAGGREAASEVLTGAHSGSVLSREIRVFGAPTLLSEAEGDVSGSGIASFRMAPRGRRPDT